MAWDDLDVLVLDLPPGTGDIQLTIVQTVALESAKKALLEKKAGPEAAELMALIQRSTAQLNLKRKRRAHA